MHAFTVSGIERAEAASTLTLRWDGTPIGVERRESREVTVSGTDTFAVEQARVVALPDPHVELRFTDPAVGRQLQQVIDSILANSATPPIIILQGDHGPGSRLVWDAPKKTCLWERTPILNAYYLPGEGKNLLYPSISPVNSFRVVLNAYFGADLPLLPDETFFSSHRLERQVIDITAQRDSRANCSAP